MQFKDIKPGIFRANNGICYVKLSKPPEGTDVNAVSVTFGELKHFEDNDEVLEW